jgi:hypothetical protein
MQTGLFVGETYTPLILWPVSLLLNVLCFIAMMVSGPSYTTVIGCWSWSGMPLQRVVLDHARDLAHSSAWLHNVSADSIELS